jgi:hypothetical protein
MDVNEWMSYECSDEGTHAQSIHNSYTRSHQSEGENASDLYLTEGNCWCMNEWIILIMGVNPMQEKNKMIKIE